MHKQFYFLSPVEVVKVAPQNMEEVAEWCGGKVAQIESRRKPGQMEKYVHVPTAKESNQSSAYPGMYVTKRMVITVDNKLKVTYAVFRRDYFDKNYFDSPALAVDMTWERNAREEEEAVKNSPVAAAFERAQERATPKPAEPKKKDKHIPAPNMHQLMGLEYDKLVKEIEPVPEVAASEDQKLQDALKTIQAIIPGAQIVYEEPEKDKQVFDNYQSMMANLKKKTPEELAELVDKGELSINTAREVQGLPRVENLDGLFEKSGFKGTEEVTDLPGPGRNPEARRPKVQKTEAEINAEIDKLHGIGAAAALDVAIADGSVFGGEYAKVRTSSGLEVELPKDLVVNGEEGIPLVPNQSPAPETIKTKSFNEAMAELQERYDRKEITIEQFRAIRDSQTKPVAEEATTD